MGPSDPIDSPTPPGDDTAELLLASGFATIMEQEEDLQASTDGNAGLVHGPRADVIGRLLRMHHLRLGHNVALLEQRNPSRPPSVLSAHARQGRTGWAERARHDAGSPASIDQLPELVAQHVRVIDSIEKLLAGNSAGQLGELILSELANSHAEMATELAILVADGATGQDRARLPTRTDPVATTTEGNWENEGGAR